MKYFFLLIASLSCSLHSDVKINLYAKKVMDIELPTQKIIPHCSIPGDPEKKNSWLGVYVFYNQRVELLSERRQRLPEECEKYRKKLDLLLRKSQRARVIGIENFGPRRDSDLAILLNDPNIKTIDGSWIFSRVMTEKGCFGRLQACDDPRLVEKDVYTNIYE
jgi:hypothetical protein